MRRKCATTGALRWCAALAGSVPVLIVSTASAQPSEGLAIGRFAPSPAGDVFFGTASPAGARHLAPAAKLVLNYAHNPLVLERVDSDESAGKVVEHQLFAHLAVSLGLFDRALVNIDLPIALWQAGTNLSDASLPSPDSTQFGDLRLGARGLLVEAGRGSIQLGLGAYLWLPTGPSHTGTYVSDGRVRGEPMLLMGGRRGRVSWAASVGAEFRPSRDVVGTQQGTMLHVGAASGYCLGADCALQIGPELSVATVLEDPSAQNLNSELIFGARYRALESFELGAGLGPGLSSGIGTPDFRGVIELGYKPRASNPDPDSDGIAGRRDACPTTAGVRQTDPARNGCPELDRDGDLIVDSADACPEAPGPSSTRQEVSGCPDRDADGAPDAVDACPANAGPLSNDSSKNGCPPETEGGDGDGDGDGVLDRVDACPTVHGERSDDPSKNGCVADSDGDGVTDLADTCPDVPGQPPGGCPPDTDADGVIDAIDACPKEQGRRSEEATKNGCPVVHVRDSEVVILQQVQFETGKATIKKESNALLDEIAAVLDEHAEIELVEVQGHTDNHGSPALNRFLSQKRADAVKAALVRRGIEPARLRAKGYGDTVPIASNDAPEGREQNRRVQIHILKQAAP